MTSGRHRKPRRSVPAFSSSLRARLSSVAASFSAAFGPLSDRDGPLVAFCTMLAFSAIGFGGVAGYVHALLNGV